MGGEVHRGLERPLANSDREVPDHGFTKHAEIGSKALAKKAGL